MELTELRSKEEVKQDIEATRKETKQALRDTKVAWVTQNPAILAWQRTKAGAQQTKYAVSYKMHTTDCAIRDNIYKLMALAGITGAVVGVLALRKRRAKSPCC
ncbi:MAG: hypothetical protein ACK4UN_06145 [Limisphaerales bacterium]